MGIVREQGRLGWRYGAKRACSAVGSCLGIALALAGCQGGEMGSAGRISSSIIGGTPDSGDPAVILLRGSFGGFCSGTLVAPTVVLTAAHCVERGLATAIGFGLDGNQDLSPIRETHFHPGWNPSDLAHGFDIAVAILENPVSGVAPMPVARTAAEAPSIGDIVQMVGYGHNFPNAGFGLKRTAEAPVQPLLPEDGAPPDKFIKLGSPSPELDPQKCNGDSGGPTFFNGKVVGVTSFGYIGCATGAFDTRVDTYGDFLVPFLDAQQPVEPPSTSRGLFGTIGNTLRGRTGFGPNTTWIVLGEAYGVSAMVVFDGALYAASAGQLWKRNRMGPGTANDWSATGVGAPGSVSLAVHQGKLFMVADNGLWWRSDLNPNNTWTFAGDAFGVTGMASYNGDLYVASANRLWKRGAIGPQTGNDWSSAGDAFGVVAMTTYDGYLFVVSNDRLWRRGAIGPATGNDWSLVQPAPGVRALAAPPSN